MKNSFLLSLCLVAAPALAQAQEAAPVRFGLKAGATLTTIMGDHIADQPKLSPLAGAVGGVFATVPLGTAQHWFVQPELLYSQQGYRLAHPETDYKLTARSNYVKLPVLLGYTYRGFFVAVGPQVGYLTSVRNSYQFRDFTATGTLLGVIDRQNTDLRFYNRWEFSAAASLGYRWACGAGIELRYFEALFNQRGNRTASNPGYPDARSAGGQVQASYLLPWH